jgi:hypothetical protein
MNDEDLAGRLRAAVLNEAGPAADDALADRLLHGTARPRRVRRAGALAFTAVVLAGAVLGGASLLAGGEDTLVGEDVAGSPDVSRLTVREAGAVTVEQAAREGVDGTAECQSDAISAPPPDGAGVTLGLSLYAAYLTDADGYEQWSREYAGDYTTAGNEQAEGPALLALCWFAGNVPADLSVGRPTAPPTHQLVVVQVSGTAGMAGLRLDGRSPRPLPVLAPPPPADAPADALLRSFPQPDGVPVVDELPPRAPPSPVEPVDCTPTACADPNQEVVVRAETRLDGEPLDPRGFRDLTPGQTVTLELTLDVEEGQTISDVHFALSDGGLGTGPDGPLGLGEVFVRAPTVAGSRTFDVAWTVPELDQAQQLVLYYRSDKYQAGSGHARTVGGVTVPGAGPYG